MPLTEGPKTTQHLESLRALQRREAEQPPIATLIGLDLVSVDHSSGETWLTSAKMTHASEDTWPTSAQMTHASREAWLTSAKMVLVSANTSAPPALSPRRSRAPFERTASDGGQAAEPEQPSPREDPPSSRRSTVRMYAHPAFVDPPAVIP